MVEEGVGFGRFGGLGDVGAPEAGGDCVSDQVVSCGLCFFVLLRCEAGGVVPAKDDFDAL